MDRGCSRVFSSFLLSAISRRRQPRSRSSSRVSGRDGFLSHPCVPRPRAYSNIQRVDLVSSTGIGWVPSPGAIYQRLTVRAFLLTERERRKNSRSTRCVCVCVCIYMVHARTFGHTRKLHASRIGARRRRRGRSRCRDAPKLYSLKKLSADAISLLGITRSVTSFSGAQYWT